MILRVGPFLYRVHLVDTELRHEGERCLGLCDNETHEIFVSTRTSFAQQVQIICHEYMEAWVYHFGQPYRDAAAPDRLVMEKEACCDLFGLAMAQFVMDMVRQLDELGRDAAQGPIHAPPSRPDGQTDARHGARPDARHDADGNGVSGEDEQDVRESIATKLADAAARAGLQVRRVHEPRA